MVRHCRGGARLAFPLVEVDLVCPMNSRAGVDKHIFLQGVQSTLDSSHGSLPKSTVEATVLSSLGCEVEANRLSPQDLERRSWLRQDVLDANCWSFLLLCWCVIDWWGYPSWMGWVFPVRSTMKQVADPRDLTGVIIGARNHHLMESTSLHCHTHHPRGQRNELFTNSSSPPSPATALTVADLSNSTSSSLFSITRTARSTRNRRTA